VQNFIPVNTDDTAYRKVNSQVVIADRNVNRQNNSNTREYITISTAFILTDILATKQQQTRYNGYV